MLSECQASIPLPSNYWLILPSTCSVSFCSVQRAWPGPACWGVGMLTPGETVTAGQVEVGSLDQGMEGSSLLITVGCFPVSSTMDGRGPVEGRHEVAHHPSACRLAQTG